MAIRSLTIRNIFTDRYIYGPTQVFRHLIYEWEDQIASVKGIPLVSSRLDRTLREGFLAEALMGLPGVFSCFTSLESLLASRSKSLYFTLSPQNMAAISTNRNVVPIIVDYWKHVNFKMFCASYRKSPLVLLSSVEALNFLKGRSCPVNLHHFPLSIPDQYRITSESIFQKQFDVILAGRQSPVLMEFMRRFGKAHPDVEYLYQVKAGERHAYVSSKTGQIGELGEYDRRSSYFGLLRASRVGIYSTPGIDGGEARTGGFNPVTPRFLELLSAGCHVVARYPDNDDTSFFRLKEICPSVDSYDAFEFQLESALSRPPPMRMNSEYLEQHYTSRRIAQLNQLLHDYDGAA